MNLRTISLDKLNPADYNPREITKDEFEGLKTSLETFGQQENLIVNKDMTVISGHQRLEAMKALGWTEATCNVVDLDKHQEKKLNVIMNSTAITGKYDDLKLGEILEELKLDEDYESLRLDKLEPLDLSDIEVEEDEAPEVSSEPPVSVLGEVYQLGRHRVMCGDSTDKASVELLMNGKYADFCFTSPPYSDMRDYGGGDMSVEKIASFLSVDNCRFYAVNLGLQRKDNAINRYWDTYIELAEARGLKLSAWNIWSKRGMGGSIANMSAMFPIEHEWILVFGGSKEDINRTKKNKTAGLHTGISNRQKDGTTKKVAPKTVQPFGVMGSVYEGVYATGEKEHPAVYPIHLPVEYINACTQKGDIVYEPFTGSGTNVIACEQTDRTCYGMEIDPKYVDVIRKRYWKFINDGNEEGWEEGTPKL